LADAGTASQELQGLKAMLPLDPKASQNVVTRNLEDEPASVRTPGMASASGDRPVTVGVENLKRRLLLASLRPLRPCLPSRWKTERQASLHLHFDSTGSYQL
jgi:hypothetical protein